MDKPIFLPINNPEIQAEINDMMSSTMELRIPCGIAMTILGVMTEAVDHPERHPAEVVDVVRQFRDGLLNQIKATWPNLDALMKMLESNLMGGGMDR